MSSNSEKKLSESTLSDSELAQQQALDLQALLQANLEEDVDYVEMFQGLNSTEAMARGVEQKLDNILESLDALLESLGDTSDQEIRPRDDKADVIS